MSGEQSIRQIMLDKQLASLGDSFVNFVYSLALTRTEGRPNALKVSDRNLADAFKIAGLRVYLGTRITKKDLANASEALLVGAYQRKLLTIEEAVETLSQNPDGMQAGLAALLKLAEERIAHI